MLRGVSACWRGSRAEPGDEGEVVAEPEEGAGELDQPDVVLGLRLPPDEDAAPPGEPAVGPLDDPAPGRVRRVGRWRAVLGPAWRDVRGVVVVDGGLPAGRGVVAGIEAEVLRPGGLGLGTLERQRLDGGLQQLV